jgi:hypothetical protein
MRANNNDDIPFQQDSHLSNRTWAGARTAKLANSNATNTKPDNNSNIVNNPVYKVIHQTNTKSEPINHLGLSHDTLLMELPRNEMDPKTRSNREPTTRKDIYIFEDDQYDRVMMVDEDGIPY